MTTKRLALYCAVAVGFGILRLAFEDALIQELHVVRGYGTWPYWMLPALAALCCGLFVRVLPETRRASLKVIGSAMLGVLIGEVILGISEWARYHGAFLTTPEGSIVSLWQYRMEHASPIIAIVISVTAGSIGGCAALFIKGVLVLSRTRRSNAVSS